MGEKGRHGWTKIVFVVALVMMALGGALFVSPKSYSSSLAKLGWSKAFTSVLSTLAKANSGVEAQDMPTEPPSMQKIVREPKPNVLDVGSAAAAHVTKTDLWKRIEQADGPKKYELFRAHGAGQDAFYASASGPLIVADGVGSWKDAGAVGRLSRTLVNNLAEGFHAHLDRHPCESIDLYKLLEESFEKVPEKLKTFGSTTCVIGIVCAPSAKSAAHSAYTLRVLNLGDSGIRIFRPGEGIIFATPEQQHFANCPFQLGGESPDTPADAVLTEVAVRPGDIVVAGSDGLFDNLHDHEIAQVLQRNLAESPAGIAKTLLGVTLDYAYPAKKNTSERKQRPSPFAIKYDMQEEWGNSGKPDDITIVLGVVQP